MSLALTTVTKYTLQLVNHGVGWELWGIRLKSLIDLISLLTHRHEQLVAQYDAKLEAGANYAEPHIEVKLTDLIGIATQYLKRAHDNGHPILSPEPGAQLAAVVGPGVVLIAEGFIAGETLLRRDEPFNPN